MVSFIADKIVMDGLTFDDVLLVPGYSEVLPRTVALETLFFPDVVGIATIFGIGPVISTPI